MNSNELNRIIAGCLKNQRREQQQLYEYTYTSLAAVVSLYAKDKTERDWIFNVGMMKIFNRLSEFSIGTNYLGWARTILVYTAIDHYRKASTKNVVDIDVEKVQVGDFSVLNQALVDMEIETITNCIQQLPKRERTVFNLAVVEGYAHKEIQAQTQINQNTSKWLLNKAKKRLQKMLADLSFKNKRDEVESA